MITLTRADSGRTRAPAQTRDDDLRRVLEANPDGGDGGEGGHVGRLKVDDVPFGGHVRPVWFLVAALAVAALFLALLIALLTS